MFFLDKRATDLNAFEVNYLKFVCNKHLLPVSFHLQHTYSSTM